MCCELLLLSPVVGQHLGVGHWKGVHRSCPGGRVSWGWWYVPSLLLPLLTKTQNSVLCLETGCVKASLHQGHGDFKVSMWFPISFITFDFFSFLFFSFPFSVFFFYCKIFGESDMSTTFADAMHHQPNLTKSDTWSSSMQHHGPLFLYSFDLISCSRSDMFSTFAHIIHLNDLNICGVVSPNIISWICCIKV